MKPKRRRILTKRIKQAMKR